MENFIVSARKYRPVTFDSVVGQNHITSTLKNAIQRGQIAHAYLFCGPRGVGKTTCARIFAKAINCQNPANHEACGVCESCVAFDQGRSFTIHELDAASNNSVDDIRLLIDKVRIPPQIGRYSVYIIDEVHMLSAQAFNAFLKTLEEPPAHAIFILATTEKHKIIPTILSRCQIYDFNSIKVDDGVKYLKFIAESEGIKSDDESLHLIAQKAEGGMRDALSMFDKVVSFCGTELDFKRVAETLNILDYETYFKITDFILAADYSSLLLIFDDILRRGFGGQSFISGLSEHFRSLLMAREPSTITLLEVTEGMAKQYIEQSKRCNTQMLFDAINLLSVTDTSFKYATNQRLHVELALLKLSGLGQKKNVVTENLPLPEPVAKAMGESVAKVVAVSAAKAVSESVEKATSESAEKMAAVVGTTAESAPKPIVEGVKQQEIKQEAEAIEPKPAANISIEKPVQKSTSGSMTGLSIKDLMSVKVTPVKTEEKKEEQADEQTEIVVSESDVERIAEACLEVSTGLMKERPRLAAALSRVTVNNNIIEINVSNQTLKDEILRNKIELQKMIVAQAEIDFLIEFEVSVVIDNSFIRPIKADDKMKYFFEKNPQFGELCKLLKLEIN